MVRINLQKNFVQKSGNSVKQILWLLFFLSFVFCSVSVLMAQKADNTEKEQILQKEKKLLSIQQNMKENIDRLDLLSNKETTLLDELEKIDFELELLSTKIKLLELKAAQYTSEMSQIEDEISKRKTETLKQETILYSRLRAVYKRGQWSILRLVFFATSISELARNVKIMGILASTDKGIIHQHRRWIDILSERTQELTQLEKKLEMSSKSLAENKKEVLSKKRMKSMYLEKIRNQKDYFLRRQEKLEEAAKNIDAIIKEMKGITWDEDFEQYKKRLPWPVRGRVKRLFGRHINKRFQTYTFSNGILIGSTDGKPVSVIAKGKVRYAGWFQGYGNLVIVQHSDDYYSLYGHLSEILVAKDDTVATMDIIGRVGDTGSDSGYVLYFEIRKKGIPLNPLFWLVKL